LLRYYLSAISVTHARYKVPAYPAIIHKGLGTVRGQSPLLSILCSKALVIARDVQSAVPEPDVDGLPKSVATRRPSGRNAPRMCVSICRCFREVVIGEWDDYGINTVGPQSINCHCCWFIQPGTAISRNLSGSRDFAMRRVTLSPAVHGPVGDPSQV
jgi:hypothetical protein